MRHEGSQRRSLKVVTGLVLIGLVGCANEGPAPAASGSNSGERWSFHDWPTGPYRVVEDWPKPLPDDLHSHEGWTWGSFGGVYAENPDRIWVAMRGELPLPPGVPAFTPYAMLTPAGAATGGYDAPGNATGNADGMSATCTPVPTRGWERRFEHSIFVVDSQGNMIDHWPQLDELFDDPGRCGRGPHQIKISPYDPERHVWIIDDQLHMIYIFNQQGELVRSHGEYGVPGRGPNNFARPTDVAWLPDGTYFISDGYDGKRVAKFDPDGNFLMDWGQAPVDPNNPGPSEFNNPHSIAISSDRRLFVVDRGHERMQVFDENGNFLDMWPLRSPHWPAEQNTLFVNHYIDQSDNIWVGDAPTARIIKFDLDGNYLYSWGAPGAQAGRLNCSHGISTDQLGNLYLADCFAGRVQKFEPLPDADPSKIAGPILRTWDTWRP